MSDRDPNESPDPQEPGEEASEATDPFHWSAPAAGEHPEEHPAPPRRWGRTLLSAAVAASLLLAGGIGIGWELARSGGASPAAEGPLTAASPESPGRALADAQAIADKVDPAVVDINTIITDALGQRGEGAGTGMIVSSSGEVLTNNHVIQGATSILVTVPGHTGRYTARVLGASPSADVALLQISGVSGLPTVTLANSSALRVGQQVVAIGNALGQGGQPTVTEGAISSLHRSVMVGNGQGGAEHLRDVIQTTAPIQPGDSGGALVNASGQVVGMITAGSRDVSRFGTGVGFAIASDNALSVVNQVRAGRASSSVVIGQPGFLGVGVRDVDAIAAERLGLGNRSGALVLYAPPGGPADRAGIKPGAVITAIDGTSVASADALGPAIRSHRPGDTIRVTWVDQGGTHSATVTLATGPAV